MTMPSLQEELAEEYGDNVTVEVVTPGTSDDPSSNNANSQSTDAPTPTGEGDATAAGAQPPAGGTAGDAGTQTTEEPTATAPEGAAAAGEEEDGEDDLTPEQETELRARLEREIRDEVRDDVLQEFRDTELPKIQSGFDRRAAALQQENEALQSQVDELDRKIREESIKGLTPEEQEKMREAWANEDRNKELNQRVGELDSWHMALTARQLLLDYGQYGVTEEDLASVGTEGDDDLPAQWELYCKDRKIEYLEQHGNPTNGTEPKETVPAKASEPSPTQQAAQKAPPAGSSAPTDVGAGGVPPAPVDVNQGKGVDAMADNISNYGWENAPREFTSAGRRG